MSNPYESDKLVNEYLLFHYGQPNEILPFPEGPHQALDFAVRSVTAMVDEASLPETPRALDLGCAVGRASFTLSQYGGEVLGIDFSQAFIQAAQHLASNKALAYDRIDEGLLTTRLMAKLPAEAQPGKVTFEQGDAMALRNDLGDFDICLLANLLCRLPDPRKCLDRLPKLVRPGGQLIITSPYTWLDDFTPRSHWLGGYREGDRPIVTLESLRDALEPAFTLEKQRDLPMLIREHARKYQWTMSEGTRWRRQ